MSAIVAEFVRTGYSLVPAQLAYHEAAHALIAFRCGRVISSVTVGQHGGLTRSTGPSSPVIGLLVAISGDLGEGLAPGFLRELIGFPKGQDQQDAEQCLNLIASGRTEREWILEDARRQVDELLVAQRDQLDKLGRMLLRRRTLEGRELRALLE